MWNDIIIGKSKNKEVSCTSIRISGISVDNISENSESYRVGKCMYNTGITIYKDTSEGIKLSDLIKNKYSKGKIENYLDKLILENISLSMLKSKINNMLVDEYERGKEDKLNEIQRVLRISKYNW